jgi:hypothetical protein
MKKISWTDVMENVEAPQSHGGKENPTYNKKREG